MIKSKAELNEYIAQDRLMNGLPSKRTISEILLDFVRPSSVSKYLYLLRKAEYYTNSNCGGTSFLKLFFQYRLSRYSRKMGYSIGLNTCGPGLSLPHYGTIIINSKARIGMNCRIHACVNIGASGGSRNAPIIGNNVYIGPSAVVFGDIVIADNVTIGANATVNKSVLESNVTIAGTPAKIVKTETRSWIDLNSIK